VDPLLLKPEEAARVLGIGRSKLFELLAAGELPVVRIGHCTRIPAADLAHWVEARTAGRPLPPSDGGHAA
jgi:excisionase family DNA binding protein